MTNIYRELERYRFKRKLLPVNSNVCPTFLPNFSLNVQALLKLFCKKQNANTVQPPNSAAVGLVGE